MVSFIGIMASLMYDGVIAFESLNINLAFLRKTRS